jgi:hypothetical protein
MIGYGYAKPVVVVGERKTEWLCFDPTSAKILMNIQDVPALRSGDENQTGLI